MLVNSTIVLISGEYPPPILICIGKLLFLQYFNINLSLSLQPSIDTDNLPSLSLSIISTPDK